MARRERIVYFCDYDEEEIPEGEPRYTRAFTLDGRDYRPDLCGKHQDALQEAVGPFLGNPVPRQRGTASAHRPPALAQSQRQGWRGRRIALAEIRDWARQNGHNVSDRGRVPDWIMAEFEAQA